MPKMTFVSILASSPAELGAIASAFMVAASFAVATIVLFHALRRTRGTTLAAPVVWSLISLAALGIAPVAMCQMPWTVSSVLRNDLLLLAATSTLCPMIALLGAKLPQNRAWQFIVLSFWLIAAWPVMQRLLFQDRPIDVPAFWVWLYGAVLLIEVVNYWPTFFCTAVLLAVGGQLMILWIFLGGLWRPLSADDTAAGFCLLATAAVWASLLRRWRNVRRAARNSGWDRVWLDFRDDYGLVWGVRVMERINALSASAGASIALDWKGFYFLESPSNETRALDHADLVVAPRRPPADDEFAKLEPGIRNLLRRFVSSEWIDSRLQSTSAAQRPSDTVLTGPTAP